MTEMVRQHGDRDCFLCCMCMALGLSYEQMTQQVSPALVQRIQQEGTFSEDIALVMRLLGLDTKVQVRSFYRHDPALSYGSSAEFARDMLWGRRALIQVKSLNVEGGRHIVYWDGEQLFDPSNQRIYLWDTLQPLYITIFDETKK